MQACVSGLKAYKRGYVYWYMHMIAPPCEDNVGHVFKIQKTRMMLLHVCVHVHTVCVYGHVHACKKNTRTCTLRTFTHTCVHVCVNVRNVHVRVFLILVS